MSKEALNELSEIKMMMTRSTKFLSLSGWSGIWVGLCGLLASGTLYYWQTLATFSYLPLSDSDPYQTAYTPFMLVGLAIVTFITAVAGGFYFTIRKTKQSGTPFLTSVTKRLLVRFATPLVIAAVLCLILYSHYLVEYTLATTLLFYGLALFTIQEDTVKEVKSIASLEIILGLLAFYFVDRSLLFWALGFGAVHLLYGIILWNKYDKTRK